MPIPLAAHPVVMLNQPISAYVTPKIQLYKG
jgi:hypothetical protein